MTGNVVYFSSADSPDGRFMPLSQVRVSPHDRGFMFSDGVYEVIRTYSGRLFHCHEHLARLAASLAALRIEFADCRTLEPVATELIRRNGLSDRDALVYVQVTRGDWPRQQAFPPATLAPTVFVEVQPLDPHERESERGVACVTFPDVRWQGCDIKSVGLLPNVLARQHAAEHHAAEAIFIRDGRVTEGSHTSVFAVRGETIWTHPCDERILPGITRGIVLDLCARLGIPAKEQPIPAASLDGVGELFLVCTSSEILPVTRLDGREVCTGEPGPLTRRLQVAFREYVLDYFSCRPR
jgi:D-alanine transaminase